MIERKFVKDKIKEFQIQEFISNNLRGVGHSFTRVQRTPLGDKIVIHASRPGLIVGRKGQNIQKLTSDLKKKFSLDNPQIEISEVEDVNLDANIIAERIANSLERYGTTRFKGIGHKVMADVMDAGALGVEIIISGKIPSARAKNWRFYSGYLKKCGDMALTGVDQAYTIAKLKTGIIGIKVSIMPASTRLLDSVQLLDEKQETVEEVAEDKQLTEVVKKGKNADKEKGTKKHDGG